MKYIIFLLFLTIGLNSCNDNYDDNMRSNSYMIEKQQIEIQSAFDTLQSLFEVPNSFRIKDIYSEQIDSVEKYISEIPKEVFFYYTVENTDSIFCSKFFVDKNNIETIYHMKTKEETKEFEDIQNKTDFY